MKFLQENVDFVKPNKKISTLSEVRGMFPLLRRGLGRRGNLKFSEENVSPSLEFVSSPQLTNKFFSLPRRERSNQNRKTFREQFSHPFWERVRERGYSQTNSNKPDKSNNFQLKQKSAFTLAEVLITLGVIGVVSAMTLPSVVKNYQQNQTVTKLKKMYTILLQAAQSYQAKNGIYINEFNTSLGAKDFMEEYFNSYLKILKTCENSNECWQGNLPKELDEKTNITVDYGVILTDGSILGITSSHSGKVFYFDLDGAKGKNRSGRDIFNFYLINTNTIKNSNTCNGSIYKQKSGIYPGGIAGCWHPFTKFSIDYLLANKNNRNCNKNDKFDSKDGNACAAVIMLNGWKIPKDYPW